MTLYHQTLAVTRYAWTRVRRTWWLPAAVAGGLATGLLTVTQTVAVTGMGVLQQAAEFLPLLHLGIMVLVGLAVDPERDEDSAAVLWSWPLETPALVLGKLAGVAPLAALAALGAAVPPAVRMAAHWAGTGLPWGYLLAEWGLLLLWLGAGATWAAAVGGALGFWARSLQLFAAILAVWLAGILGPYVFQGVVGPFFPAAWLLQWSGSGMLPADFDDADLYTVAGDMGLLLAHRALYGLAGLALVALLAIGYRRSRSSGRGPRWGLRLAAGFLAVSTVAVASGATLVLYDRADAARQEVRHYARAGSPTASAGAGADVAPEEGGLAITRYELEVDARRPPVLAVRARLTLVNPGRRSVAGPTLTLRHVFEVRDIRVAAPREEPLRWTRQGDLLRLDGLVLPPHQSATITLDYAGRVDQWRPTLEIPPARRWFSDLPWVWRGPFASGEGLYLPVSLGWYPLAGRVPLATVLQVPGPGREPGGLVLAEGPTTSSAQVIRWPGLPPAVMNGGTGEDWRAPVPQLRAAFRVTVYRNGSYPVLSNLQHVHGPYAPAVTMEGETAYLTLVGRPLARAVTATGEVYYPAALPHWLEDGLEWASWLRKAYRWFGLEVRPRIITYPTHTPAVLLVDPASGVVIQAGPASRSLMIPQQAYQAVFLGNREPELVESCLLDALLAARSQDRAALDTGDGPSGPGEGNAGQGAGDTGDPGLRGPCDDLPGGPRRRELIRWLVETPRPVVTGTLSRLRQVAAQRPLAPADLREAVEP